MAATLPLRPGFNSIISSNRSQLLRLRLRLLLLWAAADDDAALACAFQFVVRRFLLIFFLFCMFCVCNIWIYVCCQLFGSSSFMNFTFRPRIQEPQQLIIRHVLSYSGTACHQKLHTVRKWKNTPFCQQFTFNLPTIRQLSAF